MSTTTHAQHTPGPWTVNDGTFKQAHICGHEDVMIAVISKQDPQCDGGRSTETEMVNARLIAAAPELLAALRLAEIPVRKDVAAGRCPPGVLDAILTAIAKAEGRA